IPWSAQALCNVFTSLTIPPLAVASGSLPLAWRRAPGRGRMRRDALGQHPWTGHLRSLGSPLEAFGGMRMRYPLSGRTTWLLSFSLVLLAVLVTLPWGVVRSGDPRDSPLSGLDPSADINDVYVFVNPLDSTKVIFAMT